LGGTLLNKHSWQFAGPTFEGFDLQARSLSQFYKL